MIVYGETDGAAKMLEPSTAAGFSDGLSERIDAMRSVVSRLIDAETGRSFGSVGVSQTRTMRTGLVLTGLIVLDAPARSISAITVGVTDAGGVISGGSPLAASQWTPGLLDGDGNITAVNTGVSAGGSLYAYGYLVPWPSYSTFTITGVWADEDTDLMVPDDINWVCNYITAKSIAEEQASPAGFVGNDGAVVPIRNPWTEPKVKRILRNHQLATMAVVL